MPEADAGSAADSSRKALHAGHARPRVFAFGFGVSVALVTDFRVC